MNNTIYDILCGLSVTGVSFGIGLFIAEISQATKYSITLTPVIITSLSLGLIEWLTVTQI